MRRYVIFDRDGTLIKERHYLSDPREVELIQGVSKGLRRLAGIDIDIGLLLISNQSGIGRGYFTAEHVERVHCRVAELLAEDGVHLQGFYYCPHAPEDVCSCRKPAPGLVRQAAAEHGFEAQDCIIVGDRACDIELGKAVGATTFLVRTGYGEQVEKEGEVIPDYIVDSAGDAVPFIEEIYG
jgi:D-glycero-D-manno-heptose 1,7-bisphosphate phosphatase